MGLKGRQMVEEHYNINKLNDRLVEIYQQVRQVNFEIRLVSKSRMSGVSYAYGSYGNLQRSRIHYRRC